MIEERKKGKSLLFKDKIEWLYLFIFVLAFASFFMQWAAITPPKGEDGAVLQYSLSAPEIVSRSGEFTTKYEMGVFSGMNLLSGFVFVYAVPVMAGVALAAMFIKRDDIKKVIYWFTASVFAVVSVYGLVMLKKSTSYINEIESVSPGVGLIICCFAGIALAGIIIKSKKKKQLESDIFEEKEDRLKKQYLVLSVLALFCPFIPFIRIFVRGGLNKIIIFGINLFEFIRISPDVKVISIFSRYGSKIGMGASAVFYLIPIFAALTLAMIFIKNRFFRKLAAFISSILLIGAPIVVTTILSDNKVYFDNVSNTGAYIGSYLMFVIGVCLFAVFIFDKREDSFKADASLRANHAIGYIALSVFACLLFFMPLTGLPADIANNINIAGGEIPAGMAYPLSVPAAVTLLGGGLLYIAYLIPIMAILTMVSVLMDWGYVRKTAAYINAALLIIIPILTYSMLGRAYGEMGVVKLKFASILSIACGVALLIAALTDKKDQIAHSNMWSKIKKAFEVVTTASFAIIQLYPLVWLFLSSFKNNSEIFSGKVLAFPKVWHFENYSRVMFGAQADETIREAIARSMSRQKDMTLFKFILGGGSEGNIIRYFMNSAFVVVITVAVVILLGAMASYAITRIKWKHSTLVFTFFILGMMIPVHVALSPLYVVFAGMSLIDSLWSLIIPYIGFGLPISIIIICGFMESIPYEIEESATIDGANIFTVFFKIIIPMVMPAVSTVLIFVFLQSWNELMFATSFINSGVNRTITVGINSIAKSQYNTEYALIFAGLVIASLPTIIIYLAGSQQVQKSLIVGAVKG